MAVYKRKSHHISFKHAFEGIVYAFKTQPNFKVHSLVFLGAMIASYFFSVSAIELLAILGISALVFSLELVNTALEALGDEVAEGEWKELIKVAKDTMSGAVLVASVFAVVIGVVVFGPRILELFHL